MLQYHFHRRTLTRGFTLIELLIVVTMIVILVSLGFLGWGKYRELAQAANAVGSIRQIGMAQVAYASEHHGAINTLRYEGESDYLDASQPVTDSFWGKMHPYLFSIPQVVNQVILRNDLELALKSLFSTKDVRLMSGTPFGGYPIYTDSSGLPLPVAFNSEIMPEFNQASRPVAAIGNPARIIYISYGYEKITPEDGQAYRERPDENSGDGRRGIFWLSTKKAILCFLDGHVETVSEPIPERFFSVQ